QVHGLARTTFGGLQIEARAECPGSAGEHHDRGVAVVLEAACCLGELTHRFRRQRIDAVAAVKAHHSDSAFRTEAPFDRHKIGHHAASLTAIFANDSANYRKKRRLPFSTAPCR